MKTRIVNKQPYRGGFSDKVPQDEQERLKKKLETVDVEIIEYRSLDGLEIPGFVVRPKGVKGDLPCIIFNRGGNNGFCAINTSMLADWWARMANWGYVVIGSQYRGTHTRGKDEDGGADLGDVLALKDVLEEIDGVDTKRIGMFGFSRGGMMTYMIMRKVDWVDAAVTAGAPVDLAHSLVKRPGLREVFENAFEVNEEELQKRSVVHWIDELPKTTPLMVLQGGDDWRVDPKRVKEFAEMLDKTDIPHKFKLFPGAGHWMEESEDEMFELVEGWFGKYLSN